MHVPDKIAVTISAIAITQRFSARYGYSSLPSTESMVNRNICGVSEFKSVIKRDAMTAVTKYLFAPVKNRAISCAFRLFLFIIVSYPIFAKSNIDSNIFCTKKESHMEILFHLLYLNFTAVPYTITSAAPCINEDEP